jgi:hypothetical protein
MVEFVKKYLMSIMDSIRQEFFSKVWVTKIGKQLDPGYAYYRDNISKAPYAYNKVKGYF